MLLGERVLKVRAKNAGPYWITVDIFCGSPEAYREVTAALSTPRVAALFDQPAEALKRFEIADLMVLKFSFPRPVIQGSRFDRDMHGAQWSVLLQELQL